MKKRALYEYVYQVNNHDDIFKIYSTLDAWEPNEKNLIAIIDDDVLDDEFAVTTIRKNRVYRIFEYRLYEVEVDESGDISEVLDLLKSSVVDVCELPAFAIYSLMCKEGGFGEVCDRGFLIAKIDEVKEKLSELTRELNDKKDPFDSLDDMLGIIDDIRLETDFMEEILNSLNEDTDYFVFAYDHNDKFTPITNMAEYYINNTKSKSWI